MIALLGAAGCIVFDEPINVPPQILAITAPQAPTVRGAVVRLGVEASDPDQDVLTLQWRVVSGTCAALPTTDASATGTSFDWKPTLTGPHCVWVTAVDEYGARSSGKLPLQVLNARPTAAIQTLAPRFAPGKPFPLFSRFRMGNASRDPDGDAAALVATWTLVDAAGTQTTPPPCMDDARAVCFVIDRPGTHVLAVMVTDQDGDKDTANVSLSVLEDRPPCLVDLQPAVSPLPREAGASTTFSVRVDDDGDPLPAPSEPSMASLTWSLRLDPEGPFERAPIGNTRQFTLPGQGLRIGDEVAVRVEVKDRVVRPACASDQTTCASAPGCSQRFTWIVEYR